MPRLNVSRLEEWLQELQPALPHQLPFGAGPAPSHHGEVALAALPAATGVSHSRSRADIEAPAEGKTAPVDAPSGPWSTGRAEKAANLVGLEHGKRTEQQPQLHRQQAAGAGAEPPHAEQGVAAPGIGGRVATGGGAGAGTGSPAEGLAVVGAEAPSRVGVHRSPPSSRASGRAPSVKAEAEAEAGPASQGAPRHSPPSSAAALAMAATGATAQPLEPHTQPAVRMDEEGRLQRLHQQQQRAACLRDSADADAVSGAAASPRQAAAPLGNAAPTTAGPAALLVPNVQAAHPAAAGAPPAAGHGGLSQLPGHGPAPTDTCGPAARHRTAGAAAAASAADIAGPMALDSEPTGTTTGSAAMANTAAAGAAVGLGYGAAQPPLSAVVSYGAQLARRLVQVQRLKSRLGELEELLCDRLVHVRCHLAAAQGGAHARAAGGGQHQQPCAHADAGGQLQEQEGQQREPEAPRQQDAAGARQSAVADKGPHPGDQGPPFPAAQGLGALARLQPGGAAHEREQARGEQQAPGARSRGTASAAPDEENAKAQGGDEGEAQGEGADEDDPPVGPTSRPPQPPRALLLLRPQQPGLGAGPSTSPRSSPMSQADAEREAAAGTVAAAGGAAWRQGPATGGLLGVQHGADEAVAVEVLAALRRMSPGLQEQQQQQQGLRPEAEEGQHVEEQQGRLGKWARAGGDEGLGPDLRTKEPSGGPAARAGAAQGVQRREVQGGRVQLPSPGSPAGPPGAAASATLPAVGQQPLTAAAAATPDGRAMDELRGLDASPAAGSCTATSPAVTAAAAAAVAAAAGTATAPAASPRGLQLQQGIQQQLLRQQASPMSTPTSTAVLAQARAQGPAAPRSARAMAEALLRSAAGAAAAEGAGYGAQVASEVAGRRVGDGRAVTAATWDVARAGGPQGAQPALQHATPQERQGTQQQQQMLLNLHLREVLQQQQHAQPRQQRHRQQQQQQDCEPVFSPQGSATSGLPHADQRTARHAAGLAAAVAGPHAAAARGSLDGGRGTQPLSPPLKRQRTSEAGAPGDAVAPSSHTSPLWPLPATHASGEAGRRRSSAPEAPWAGGGGQWPSAPSLQPQPLPGQDRLQPLPLALQRRGSGQAQLQPDVGPEVAYPGQDASTSLPGSRHGLGSQGGCAGTAPGPGAPAGAPGRVHAATPGAQLLRLPPAEHRHRVSSGSAGGGGGGGGQHSGGGVLQVMLDARGHVVDVVGAHPAALLQRGAEVLQLLLPRGGSGTGRGPEAAAEHATGLWAAAEEAKAAMRRRSSSYTGGDGLAAGEQGGAGGRLERAAGREPLQQGPGAGPWHRQQAGGVLARGLSSGGNELATGMAPPLMLGLRQVQGECMAGQWGPGSLDVRGVAGAAGQQEYGQGARPEQLLLLQRQGLAGPGLHRAEEWQQRQQQQAGPGGRAELLGLQGGELQGPVRRLSGSGAHQGLQEAAGRGWQQQQVVRGSSGADRHGATLAQGGGVEPRGARPGGREAQGRPLSGSQPHTQRPPAPGQPEQQGPRRQGQGQG